MNDNTVKEMLRDRIIEYVEMITRPSKHGAYVCPLCNSGGHNTSTSDGAFRVKGTHWECFSCGRSGDIFDLIGEYEKIEDFKDKFKRAVEIFNIKVDSMSQNQYKNEQYTHRYTHTDNSIQDYTQFYVQANNDITKTDYHRGITLETLNKFKIGYVEKWRHPKAPDTVPETPRLIIPTSNESYLARDTRENLTDKEKKYSKSKVGNVHIFNADVIKTAKQPIYITEGEIDALSIIDVGGEALALGSVGNVKKFIELVEKEKTVQPFLIALDNDEAGENASENITAAFEKLGILSYRVNPAGEFKDPNEALQRDREKLKSVVLEDVEGVKIMCREEYLKNSAASYLQSFIDGIADSVNTPYTPTGFKQLDTVLDGGLYEGLYIIGAISSLGKTTLVNQISDQIAQSGKDVLIFSLEMARSEIMAKSISRHTLQHVLISGGNIRNAKTARGITAGERYDRYSKEEKNLINESILSYGEYAEHVFINEGIGDIGVKEIRNTIRKHVLMTGESPVIVVDYIQILAPYNERATDKQNTDKAVLELKRISRDYKTPVIGISSFNRANYKEAVGMSAFKESGAIEYGSDVLIGLQLKGAGKSDFDENKEKRKNPREIELVILKNRNGQTGEKIGFKYYPLFNYFEEED